MCTVGLVHEASHATLSYDCFSTAPLVHGPVIGLGIHMTTRLRIAGCQPARILTYNYDGHDFRLCRPAS